jgi:hypothetical protein
VRREQLEVGDIVRVNRDGGPFEARVTGFTESGITFEPLASWPTWRRATFYQVKERVWPPLGKRRHRADEQEARAALRPRTGDVLVTAGEKSGGTG